MKKTGEPGYAHLAVLFGGRVNAMQMSKSIISCWNELVDFEAASRAIYDLIVSTQGMILAEVVMFIQTVFSVGRRCQLITELRTYASFLPMWTDVAHEVLCTHRAEFCSSVVEGLCESAWQNMNSLLPSWMGDVGADRSKNGERRQSRGRTSKFGILVQRR